MNDELFESMLPEFAKAVAGAVEKAEELQKPSRIIMAGEAFMDNEWYLFGYAVRYAVLRGVEITVLGKGATLPENVPDVVEGGTETDATEKPAE